MDALEMEQISECCSSGATAEADTCARSTNLIYKQQQVTKVSPINESAVISNHDTRDSTNTTYNVKNPSPLPFRARSSKKFWTDTRIFRIMMKRFKSAVNRNGQVFKGYVMTQIQQRDPTSSGDRSKDLKEDGETQEVKVVQKETEWFRVEFEKKAGAAPALGSQEKVKEKLRQQAMLKRVKTAEYYRHVPQPEPISVTTLAWPQPTGIVKCLCPYGKCVCEENKLQKRRKLPGSKWLWLKSHISCLFNKNRPPGEEALPRLLASIYAGMKNDEYLQSRHMRRPRDPLLCFAGCRNFHYYKRSDSIEIPSTVKKNVSVSEDGHKGWSPKPRQTKEISLESDRVSGDDEKRSVSSQMVRGSNGEALIAPPYNVKYGQPDRPTTTILKDWAGVRLNVTFDNKANDQNTAATSNGPFGLTGKCNCNFKRFVSISTVKKYYEKLKKGYCSSTSVMG